MAKYTIILYFKTGFNLVNVPDSLATLRTAAQSSLTFTDNNILAVRGLTEFTIAATYAQVKDADYCYVYNQTDSTDYAFFAITGDPMPNSESVQTIHVALDPLISCGGISAITFLGGITERYCPPIAEDTFGAFTEEDPYLIPAEPLKIEKGALIGNSTANRKTFYESYIALDILGYMLKNNLFSAYTYVNNSTGQNVTKSEIPHDRIPSAAGWSGSIVVLPIGDAYFTDDILSNPTSGDIIEAIQYARSLGIEQPLLNSWVIPEAYLDTSGGSYYTGATNSTYTTQNNDSIPAISGSGRIGQLVGINDSTNNSTLPFEYTNVKNKRLLVGNHNKYVLASTCSGSSAEYNPEDIYDFTNPTTAPYVWIIADPRPSGMPYARFKVVHGDSSQALFFMNAVPGMVWERAPLVFYDKTGNLLDQAKFSAEQRYKDRDAEIEAAGKTGPFATGAHDLFGALGQTAGSITSGLMNLPGYITGSNGNSFDYSYQSLTEVTDPSVKIRRQREQQKTLETQQYLISQTIVAPTLQFPRNESVRDIIGNSFLAYRYRYSDNDIARLDQILTAYGYRVTTPVNASNSAAILGGRPHFNYVSIKGASVVTDKPKWMNDELSAALSTGIRIWHERPDNAYYTSGNV